VERVCSIEDQSYSPSTSKEYAEMSKKNIYPHHMGSSRYVGKIPEWKQKIEEVVSAGNPNPIEDVDERAVNWLLARLELTQDGKLVHKKKGVATVQGKAVELTAKQRLGQFKSDREKDVLSGALGTAEHTGRIRGVASQMPWKLGFPKDVWRYKKRDRYKKNIEDAIEEKMNAMFETKFRAFVNNFSQGRQLAELEQVTQTPPPPLSSIGPTTSLHTWYTVDDVMGDTPCHRHIPLGRV
jgi:hypothetical protein